MATAYPEGGFRVLVCGGPDFTDRDAVWRAMDAAHARRQIGTLLQGSVTPAVALAGEWARQRGTQGRAVMREDCPRFWQIRNKGTGLPQESTIAERHVHAVLAFPGDDGSLWPDKAAQVGVPVWRPYG